jgi:DNA-binding beta-propeller fold protein YncE
MRFHTAYCALLSCAALASTAAASDAPAPAHYHMIARYRIGGNDTTFDYERLDAAARRLYVAHGTRVEVLDADNGRKLGEIGGMHGVHGIELIADLNKGYTSDGLDRAVTVFDPATLKVRRRIKYLGLKPDAIQYDADSHRLFVVNGGATGDVTVIEPASDTIVNTIDLQGGKLEQIGFDGRGRAFVNDEGRNVLHVFDTRTLQQTAVWPLAPCEGPTGMAIDREHHRVFSACGNRTLAVVDSDSGRLVASVPIGDDPDGAVFDPGTGRIFTSNRDGTLSVVRELTPDRFEPLQTVATPRGARTLALDPTNGRLYLPTGDAGPTVDGASTILAGTLEVVTVAP